LEHEFSDTEVINMWKEIHKEILASKHGEGEFVN
jgi:hypothetical protein